VYLCCCADRKTYFDDPGHSTKKSKALTVQPVNASEKAVRKIFGVRAFLQQQPDRHAKHDQYYDPTRRSIVVISKPPEQVIGLGVFDVLFDPLLGFFVGIKIV
jgi:hypothetical protein